MSYASIAQATDARCITGKTNYRFAPNFVLSGVIGLQAVAVGGAGGCIIGTGVNGAMGAECAHNAPGVGAVRTFATDAAGLNRVSLKVAEVVRVTTPTTGKDDLVLIRYDKPSPVTPLAIVERVSFAMANMPIWFDNTSDEIILQEVRNTSVPQGTVSSGDLSKVVVKCDIANANAKRIPYSKGCGYASSQTAMVLVGGELQMLGVCSWMWWTGSMPAYSSGWIAYTDFAFKPYMDFIKAQANRWGVALNIKTVV
jgi:hypothetical protein